MGGQVSREHGQLHTPGVTISLLTGQLPGNPVDMDVPPTSLSQMDNTCFIVSVLRGLVNTPQGQTHLASRVHVDEQGTYHVRLTHDQEDFDVQVSLASLDNYGTAPGDRPLQISAVECALVNFLQSQKVDPLYSYGSLGLASDTAKLLGLQLVDSAVPKTVDLLADYLNTAFSQKRLIVYRKDNPQHFVTLGTMLDNQMVSVGDSLEPTAPGDSLLLSEIYESINIDEKTRKEGQLAPYELLTFTIPQPNS
jgi:hypothetical protein